MLRLAVVSSRVVLPAGLLLAIAGCPGSNTADPTGGSSSGDSDPTTTADSSGTSTSGMTSPTTTATETGDTSTTQDPTTESTTDGSSESESTGASSGDTTLDTSTTSETSTDCGNGVIDEDEDCDGAALVQTCEGLGFLGGTLGCNDDCGFDISACLIFACGNNLCDSAEDSCNCAQDCDDDPNACSACECGEPAGGGACGCDEDCFEAGNCCDNICDPDAACGELLFGCTVCGDGVCGIGEDSCNCEADCPDDPNSCSVCDCGVPAGGGHCGCDDGCFEAGNCCIDVCDLQACQIPLLNCPDQGNIVFEFSGEPVEFVVPAFINDVHIEVWGAEGGTTVIAQQSCGGNPDTGGLGGFAEGDLSVVPGESLFVFVGGAGGDSSMPGYNGGATSCPDLNSCTSGGGASDVRRGGVDLDDRVIVGGGGGGAEYSCGGEGGGGGGGLIGDPGTGSDNEASNGAGGTQVAGGVGGFGASNGEFGIGGNGSPDQIGHASGGGGGYWGGGGGGTDGSAGGGSSYIDGVDNGLTTANQRAGNGTVIISWGG